LLYAFVSRYKVFKLRLKKHLTFVKDTFISDYKKYGIFIDTDCRIYFKNKKDAEKFLAEQNKELSNFLNEIVFYIKNIYSELWNVWFYSQGPETIRFNKFNYIESLLNNTIKRVSADNSDSLYFIRNNYKKIIIELKELLNYMIKFYIDANRHDRKRDLELFLRNITDIESRLNKKPGEKIN